ncbi:MAG TPA: Ig-like domain-containing protein, partial [Nitrospirota bacterium]|nr:Ig-like domain-containing protein [Nitrospirota bacterium]
MKKLTFITLVLIQTGALLLTACGRLGPVPPPDKTPPSVTTVSPSDGTADFPITGTITLTFSKVMDASTINESSVPIISDTDSNTVAGSYSTVGAVTVFTPSQNLNPHTRYKIGVSTDVTDSYGIPMATAQIFYFTTQSFPPPRVVDIQPADRSKNASLRTAISILFSKPMDPDTIWTSNISLSNAAGGYYGSVEYNQTLNAATFYPDNDFASNTNYVLTISTGVTDTTGAPMASPFVSNFQTGASYNTTAPTVAPLVPNNNATNVSVNTPISATFSEPMDLVTITPTHFIVSQGTTTIPGDIKSYGNTVVFTPASPLAHSTTYVVTIKGYSLTDYGVQDLAGNYMAIDSTWQFTTGPQSADIVPLSVLAMWPTSNQNNVSVYKQVVALFSESMLASSITPTTFVLVAQNDPNKVPLPGEVKTNGAAVIFIPSQDLSYATPYTATIISTTTPTTTLGATDVAGKALPNNSTWNFTTEAPASFTITASAGPGGTITPSGALNENLNSSPTFTITPNAGYSVDDVLVDGVSQGPITSYTFSGVTSDHTISASFLMAITATAGTNGSISPSGTVLVSYNTTQVFTITPNLNYHINTVGGTCGGTLVGTTYTTNAITQNCTVQASFSANPVITVNPATNGTITPSGSVTVAYGGSQTFTFTPNAGYYLTGVSVDGVAVTPLPTSGYTFTNVIANHTISTTFAANPVITASAGANGTITPSGSVSVTYGANQTFTFTPATGYYVSAVTVDGVNVGLPNSYTFYTVTANHTIAVAFAQGSYTITATAGAGGTLQSGGTIVSSSSSEQFLVSYGGSRSFTITPNAGYAIVSVLVDGVSQGAVTSYTFTNVIANHTISATFALNPVITASAGAGGSISPSGSVSVTSGASQTFTITPNAGYSITSVLVDGVSQGAVTSYTFTNVTANHTISATFTLSTNTITASAGANGTITPSGSVSVAYGANQTFTFTPVTGYYVSAVIVDGANVGAPTSYTFYNVTAGHSISVAFLQGTNIITATAGAGGTLQSGGTIVSSGTSQQFLVSYGGSLSFTITPNTGYSIASVLVDGVSQGAITSYTFSSVTAAHTISATFAINTFTITASAGTGGGISPSGAVAVNYGASQTFTITPNTAYSIVSVLVDGVSQGAVSSYTFSSVTAAHTISATFGLNPTITASAGANGGISPSGAVVVNYGANQTFTITPNTGYSIASVLVDGVSQGAITSYTFSSVTAAHTISATFGLNPTITASAGTGGGISPSGAVAVNYNASQTFTITPTTGYSIADVQVDGVSIGAQTSYTFTLVTTAHTISATFAINTFTITASAGANGSISPSGAVAV